jgi:GalNAc-alpha-(1->4)-GalNAc-alpha-(1->3)-diNAcBac-PP-undecaprenol alpha-1,4-N-acetyl-D-galactosaminyltransferase
MIFRSKPEPPLSGTDLVVVTSDLKAGGSQRVLSTLLSALAKENTNIVLITRTSAESDFYPLSARISRVVLPGDGPSSSSLNALLANISWIFRLRAAVKSTNAPVVLSFVAGTNILTVLACTGISIRTVISERNDPAQQSLGRIWDFLRKRIYPLADVVTANSHGAITSLGTFVAQSKLEYVPNPLQRFPVVTHSRDQTVLNVGRLHKQKAQDILIAAFSSIAQLFPDWKLAILGQGELREKLNLQAEKAGIADQLVWLDATPEPFEYYSRASVFALPSRHEGTPNALLEAMAAGLPCVISDASPGPLEVVQPDETGLVVPVDDTQALAVALTTLMSNADVRERMGEKARKSVQQFELDGVLPVWTQLLGGKPEAGPNNRPVLRNNSSSE